MFAYLVLAAALVAGAAAGEAAPPAVEAATSTSPSTSSGWTALLGCVWEEDSVGCLRENSARALKELHVAKKEAAAAALEEKKDESILEVLHDGTARMIEYLKKDEEQEEANAAATEETESTDGQGRAIEEGRKKIKIGKIGKKGKKGGGLLQTFYMLKMMFGMLISMKVGLLSFLLQVKTFFLSFIFVTIAVIQFFWKLQEKKAHGGISYGPPSGGWDSGSSFGGYGPSAQSGGWDKRAWTEHAHRQAFAAQAPAS
ncbi:hypothetical protein FOCC_FOCC004836 [Frankliniella occidentalis]|uniref:Uncharacterized protein LOC113212973 n=1 Tax=Frankliniella occidentalis TaxID=133901 RepID=A0A6J1TA83_FRAOC|nr:uncharacterized protein LOC113212973 [Frankliniella occidentalis]KAE8748404.1 hypothetical protein FOCC_FOCC004836 [Frankliniella occidentalis]